MRTDTGKGYVRIHREIMDHWLWQEKPFSKGQAWIDLILLAKYKDEKFPFKDQIVEGKRGTVYRSMSSLAERWGWSRDKVRRFLNLLRDDGMITYTAATHNTTITIVKYEAYQASATANNTTESTENTGGKQISVTTDKTASRQKTDSRPTSSRHNINTYNNSNKVNNTSKEKNTSSDIRFQTDSEIAEAISWFDTI